MYAQPESRFAAAYAEGIKKTAYWEPIYEDSLNLIAKLPGLAALIYRNVYHGGKTIDADPKLDWAANLAHMMGALSPALQGMDSDCPFSLLKARLSSPAPLVYGDKGLGAGSELSRAAILLT